MLKREELTPIAKFKGLGLRLAELDYLQDVALINIYREFGNRLVFKGGTCLYKIYQLNRFSEDLDFTARKGFKPKDFFHRLPYFFNLLDVRAKVKVEQFEKGINARLELTGPLYDGRKETMTTLLLNISTRERILLPIRRFSYSSLYRELRPFDLFAMDEKEIFAEKIRAIYERNKARDVYDLWYLLSKRGVSFEAQVVNKKLSHDKVKFERGAFLSKIEEKKVSWERDLTGLVAGELPPFAQAKREIETRM